MDEIFKKNMSKIDRQKVIPKTKKIEIFSNKRTELSNEVKAINNRLKEIKEQDQFLSTLIRKLSSEGWAKFQN